MERHVPPVHLMEPHFKFLKIAWFHLLGGVDVDLSCPVVLGV